MSDAERTVPAEPWVSSQRNRRHEYSRLASSHTKRGRHRARSEACLARWDPARSPSTPGAVAPSDGGDTVELPRPARDDMLLWRRQRRASGAMGLDKEQRRYPTVTPLLRSGTALRGAPDGQGRRQPVGSHPPNSAARHELCAWELSSSLLLLCAPVRQAHSTIQTRSLFLGVAA